MSPPLFSGKGVDSFERGGDGSAAVMLALDNSYVLLFCRAGGAYGGLLKQNSRSGVSVVMDSRRGIDVVIGNSGDVQSRSLPDRP